MSHHAKMFAIVITIYLTATISVATAYAADVEPCAMRLTTTALQPGADIPRKYMRDGEDVSPPLRWQDAPQLQNARKPW